MTSHTIIQTKIKAPIAPTMEEDQAQRSIKIGKRVPAFVDFLRNTRPTASRQLFYDAFGTRHNDSDLLRWVREQAVLFQSLPSMGFEFGNGAANEQRLPFQLAHKENALIAANDQGN